MDLLAGYSVPPGPTRSHSVPPGPTRSHPDPLSPTRTHARPGSQHVDLHRVASQETSEHLFILADMPPSSSLSPPPSTVLCSLLGRPSVLPIYSTPAQTQLEKHPSASSLQPPALVETMNLSDGWTNRWANSSACLSDCLSFCLFVGQADNRQKGRQTDRLDDREKALCNNIVTISLPFYVF